MGFLSSLFSSQKEEAPSEEKPKDDQSNFDVLKYDGIRAMQIREISYAIKCFQEALKIRPDMETMNYLANAHSMIDDQESALEIINEMLLMKPERINLLLSRINLLFGLNRLGEVIADCDKVIGLDPENHMARYLRGKAKWTTNDRPGAKEDMDNVIAIKEDFADGYLFRAEIFFSTEEGEKALADVNKVIELTEDEEMAYLLRGRIHELLGDKESAINDYAKVLELNPFKAEAYLLAGRLLTTQQKYEEAMAIYDEAIEHLESFAQAYIRRGHLKELTGDRQGAEEDLRIAAGLAPENEEETGKQADFDNLYKGGIF
jgi:tetratricopeptide (TPR) repeat protein